MAIKRPSDNPTISDTIILDITTEDDNNCLVYPYKIISVTIYFVERDFYNDTVTQYTKTIYNQSQLAAYYTAQNVYCANPTSDNLNEANRLWSIVASNASTSDTYFTSTTAAQVFGNPESPAWCVPTVDSPLTPFRPILGTDLAGEPIFGDVVPGHFVLLWNPDGSSREGDYFACWNYMLYPAGAIYTKHFPFSLQGNTQITTSIPTHVTDPTKYPTLLEQYLPRMFETKISSTDLTPVVINNLQGAIAQGFVSLENMANQIEDLMDANAIQEYMIPLLSNLFNLKLRSNDPVLWRRQIKRAIPLFKKKGTMSGLAEALAQAGAKLLKYTKLYQIISNFTWTDSFLITTKMLGNTPSGQPVMIPLTYTPTSIDTNNFLLVYSPSGENPQDLSTTYYNYMDFQDDDRGNPVLAWLVDAPIQLSAGDMVRVMYTRHVVDSSDQDLENLVRALPLADQRDEVVNGVVTVPLKNWNVRVVAEDDVLLPILIPTLNPFHDPVLFGHVRTEFPYSENAYNMDEYNGSIRESTSPCDIDNEFLDPCSGCLSSKFILDMEVSELSDDRISEVTEIVKEFVPFHAVIHTLNFSGGANEYVLSPQEQVEVLVTYIIHESTISGNANPYFNRYRGTGLGDKTMITTDPTVFANDVLRSMLSTGTQVITNQAGIGYNQDIDLYAPGYRMDSVGLVANNFLEIFDGPNQGSYTLGAPEGATAPVIGAPEPVDESEFTFRLSNKRFEAPGARVFQSDQYVLIDPTVNFANIGLVDEPEAVRTGVNPWSIQFPSILPPYPVACLLPSGNLVIDDDGQLFSGGTSYVLYDSNGQQVGLPSSGVLTRQPRGLLALSGSGDIRSYLYLGDYVLVNDVQYLVSGYVDGQTNEAYLDGYDQGTIGMTTVCAYVRLLDNVVGSFGYQGIIIDGLSNLESTLMIQDGANALPTTTWLESFDVGQPAFKQNFLFVINGDYFTVSQINGGSVTLNGPPQYWGTQDSGGLQVIYSVIQFDRTETNLTGGAGGLNIDGQPFPYLDRLGEESVDVTTEYKPLPTTPLAALAASMKTAHSPADLTEQDESVSFTVKYASGETKNGEI